MKYDVEYHENLLRQYSETAKHINSIRWKWVEELKANTILDYGCGVGWFRAFSPNGATIDTYDIMDVPQTGIRRIKYDLICFWDVLEHMPIEDTSTILDRTNYVAGTMPVYRFNCKLEEWKHYKPGEHLHHLSRGDLDVFMRDVGFKIVKEGYPECPPRQDVLSFIARKVL